MIELDDREFRAALIQYQAASGKDMVDVLNRQMVNLAVQGLKISKVADRSKIRSLKDQEWWPRHIASRLSRKGPSYTVREAKRYSRAIISRRVRAVTFMKSFFAKVSQAFSPRPARGKDFRQDVQVTRPTAKNLVAEIVVSSKLRKDGGAQALLDRTVQTALVKTIADIQKYIDGKVGKTARRFSAR